MRRSGILFAVITVAVAGAIWLTYGTPFVFCRFLQEDAMDAAHCGTLSHLKDFESDPERAIAWLMTNHGAAPSQQVMYVLVDWALEHEESFLDMLSRTSNEEAAILLPRIADAVVQGRRVAEFAASFESSSEGHEPLQALLARITREAEALSKG